MKLTNMTIAALIGGKCNAGSGVPNGMSCLIGISGQVTGGGAGGANCNAEVSAALTGAPLSGGSGQAQAECTGAASGSGSGSVAMPLQGDCGLNGMTISCSNFSKCSEDNACCA